MMTLKRFYIPITSTSLPHFWASGLIMPPAFFTKHIEQAQMISTCLILIDKIFAFDANCSLEVILTDADMVKLSSLKNGVYQFIGCLPVTRISQIYFRSQDQLKTTIWNINQGAGFVPERLLKVVSDTEPSEIDLISTTEVKNEIVSKELTEKINRFNVILGGLAFMRLAYEGVYKHSENYFATLSHFNASIGNRVTWYKENKGIKFDYRYIDLFTQKDSEWAKWRNFIYRGVTMKDVEDLAKKNKIRIEKSFSGFRLDLIDSDTIFYDIVLLATYGDHKQKSLEDLISLLFSDALNESKLEEIFLLFGLQTGYSKLRNSYKVKGKQIDVKFRFDTQLDYSIVESVFEFIFYGKNSITNFEHLAPILPNSETRPKDVPDGSFLILDIIANSKKKPQNGNTSSPVSRKDFLQKIARTVYKWGTPYDTDEKMLLNTQQFVEKKLGIDLDSLIEVEVMNRISKANISTTNSELPNIYDINSTTENKLNQNHPDFENSTWTDLKKIASSKGISTLKNRKGSLKDMLALIEQIESTNTIL